MIFLSFAADFTLARALRHLFAIGTKKHSQSLQAALKKRYHAQHTTLYHNGRTALSEAIRHLVPQGSHVAINGLTCYAVPQAIKAAHCTPVYVDINPQDFNFDTAALVQVLEKDPEIRAIIIQNHLGLAADIVAIERLARKHKCIIIEDLAHCAGSHYPDGREVGTVGAAAALSFGKGKALDTTQGGALVLKTSPENDTEPPKQRLPRLADRLRDRIYPILGWKIRKTYRLGLGKALAAAAFKTHAIERSAEGLIAPNLRPAHWQAKLALAQLQSLNHTAKLRASFASAHGYPKTSSILRLPFLLTNRDQLLRQLKTRGFYLDDSWYDIPVSPKRHYKKANFPAATCPTAVEVSQQMLNLPLLPPHKLQPALDLIRPHLINPTQQENT